MTPELVLPREEYLLSYFEACRELKEHHSRKRDSLHDPDTFERWGPTLIQNLENARRGVNLKPGYVSATTFWLVEGTEFIGAGNIRHSLTPALERYGGHIGYVIRWSRWGLGYGTLQLRLLLAEAAKLGIQRALITCDDDNIGSWRVMEKCGAVYQDTIRNQMDDEVICTRRYWVNTAQR